MSSHWSLSHSTSPTNQPNHVFPCLRSLTFFNAKYICTYLVQQSCCSQSWVSGVWGGTGRRSPRCPSTGCGSSPGTWHRTWLAKLIFLVQCNKNYENPGFVLTKFWLKLPGTGKGWIIPGQGEFGKWHPGWGWESAKPFVTLFFDAKGWKIHLDGCII